MTDTIPARPRIVLLGSWQTVNIGDVAHTPGCLTALRRFAPDAEVTLVPRDLDDRELAMIRAHFPEVRVVGPPYWKGDGPLPQPIREAFDRADLLVHGSGPSVVASTHLRAWRELSAKPYGFFGITVDPFPGMPATLDQGRTMVNADIGDLIGADRDLLDGAAFVFCRDSLTRDLLRNQGITAPVIEFGPDATPAFDPAESGLADEVLSSLDTTEQLLCLVPRLRYTPYHEVRRLPVELFHRQRDAYNAAHVEADLTVLHEAARWWRENTDGEVIVVPEMSYAPAFAQRHFIAGPRLHVLDRFWSLPEASAVYQRAAAVVSLECHSPLIAMAVGTPALYVRQPTDTIKGHMYRDLGLGDRQFEIEDPETLAGVRNQLATIVADPAAARDVTVAAHDRVVARLGEMVRTAMGSLPS